MKVKHILIALGVIVALIILYFLFSGNNFLSNKSSSQNITYDCNYVWPQEIINKNTGKILWKCSSSPRNFCKAGTTQCCEWTNKTGHYNCMDMANKEAITDNPSKSNEQTLFVKTEVPETEPFVFDSTDPDMIACKNKVDSFKQEIEKGSDFTFDILDMKKFENLDDAEILYNKYRGTGISDLMQEVFDSGYPQSNDVLSYHYVIVGCEKHLKPDVWKAEGRPGYPPGLPRVLACINGEILKGPIKDFQENLNDTECILCKNDTTSICRYCFLIVLRRILRELNFSENLIGNFDYDPKYKKNLNFYYNHEYEEDSLQNKNILN